MRDERIKLIWPALVLGVVLAQVATWAMGYTMAFAVPRGFLEAPIFGGSVLAPIVLWDLVVAAGLGVGVPGFLLGSLIGLYPQPGRTKLALLTCLIAYAWVHLGVPLTLGQWPGLPSIRPVWQMTFELVLLVSVLGGSVFGAWRQRRYIARQATA